MSEYTPTTEQVRSAYVTDIEAEYRDPINAPMWQHENERSFDRWLAAHDEQVRAAERERIIAQIDATPAVTWTGKGGVRERIRAVTPAEQKESETL